MPSPAPRGRQQLSGCAPLFPPSSDRRLSHTPHGMPYIPEALRRTVELDTRPRTQRAKARLWRS
ncbi:hypothetical protein OH77DRAFT_1423158 [Trametes cingulata]|nr:hypothetical protein OH77DRAFT_1423158 [Trametes cingulata]